MGSGYDWECEKCGYTFGANLGIGFMYPVVYEETMQAARDGKLGEQAKSFLEKNSSGVINPRIVLARCKDCGEYEVLQKLSMYIPKEGKVPKMSRGNWSKAFPHNDIVYVSDFEADYQLAEEYKHTCKKCNGDMEIIDKPDAFDLTCPRCGSKLTVCSITMWD